MTGSADECGWNKYRGDVSSLKGTFFQKGTAVALLFHRCCVLFIFKKEKNDDIFSVFPAVDVSLNQI